MCGPAAPADIRPRIRPGVAPTSGSGDPAQVPTVRRCAREPLPRSYGRPHGRDRTAATVISGPLTSTSWFACRCVRPTLDYQAPPSELPQVRGSRCVEVRARSGRSRGNAPTWSGNPLTAPAGPCPASRNPDRATSPATPCHQSRVTNHYRAIPHPDHTRAVPQTHLGVTRTSPPRCTNDFCAAPWSRLAPTTRRSARAMQGADVAGHRPVWARVQCAASFDDAFHCVRRALLLTSRWPRKCQARKRQGSQILMSRTVCV